MKKTLLFAAFMLVATVFGADFFINDVKISKNYAETESEWQYSRKINLPGEDFPEEFKIPPQYLRRHPTSKHVAGFNGNVLVKITSSGTIKSFDVKGRICNFPDRVEREASFSYSLDGKNFTVVEKKTFGGKSPSAIFVGGKIELPANKNELYLKFERFYKKGDRNGQYGNVLWTNFDLNIYGGTEAAKVAAPVVNEKPAEAEKVETAVKIEVKDSKVKADLQKIAEHVSKKTKDPWTWVFYGDSITHGAAHTDGWRSFPEIFHERVRWEYHLSNDTVINSGTSGNSTVDLLDKEQYQRRIKRYTPQVVFVLIGMNDTVRAKVKDPAVFRTNLEELVKRLQADKAIVVLQTSNTVNVRLEWGEKHNYVQRFKALPTYNNIIRETAAKYSTILVDHDAHWRKNAADYQTLKSWLGEYIHPGAKGHLEMANTIFKALNIYDPKSKCSNVKACNQ